MVCLYLSKLSLYTSKPQYSGAWFLGAVVALNLSLTPQTLLAVDQLETLKVISATRTEKELANVPVRMAVITSEHIEKVHARDLKQALVDVPGLMLKEIHGKSGYGVWLQGFDADRVLVLVDGEPVSASTGSQVDLTQIATADIERIEVVKGATSALYGSSAMGGVVNVITRGSADATAWSVFMDGGSYNKQEADGASAIGTRHVKGHLTLNKNKWSAKITSSLRQTDGFDLTENTFSTQGDAGDKANASIRLAYKPAENSEFYIASSYYDEDLKKRIASAAPGTPLGEIRKHKIEKASRETLHWGGHYDTGESLLTARFFLENFTDYTEQDVIATDRIDQYRDSEIESKKAELQWDRSIGDRHYLTTGLVFFEESLRQEQRTWDGTGFTFAQEVGDGASRDSKDIFIQDDIQFSEANSLVLGVRYQNDSDFGSHIAPSANYMHTHWFGDSIEAKMRVGIGAGYRVPNLKERYFIFDHSGLGYMVFGNPDLQPESNVSYQLGVELFGDKSHVDASLFYNDVEKLIETDLQSHENGVAQYAYTNIDKAILYGAELRYVSPLTDALDLSLSYTWLKSKDDLTRNALPDRPEHQVKAGLEYDLPRWDADVGLFGTYQSKEYVELNNEKTSPAWNTWDLKFNKHFSEQFHVYFGIDNLFDKHRETFDGIDQSHLEPRLIYIGLSINS